MTPDEMTEMRDSVRRIEAGLFGDEKLDQVGLIGRVKSHGKRIARVERVMVYLTGAAMAVIAVYHIVVDLLVRH